MDVTGLGVVVTGAGSGIGRAIAIKIASQGGRVVVSDIDGDAAEETAELVDGWAIGTDAGSLEGIEELVAAAQKRLGRIDVWFGNAGVDRGRTLSASELEWSVSYQVNVMAHVRAARLLIPQWLETGGGRFVITASAAGLLTMLEAPTYAVTKHGAIAFAEWLSATYRHLGVVVQVVCPQAVRTQMLERIGDVREILGHDGTLDPGDVAEAILAGMQDHRFWILPHPEVGRYARNKFEDIDRWLTSMNRIQQKTEEQRRE